MNIEHHDLRFTFPDDWWAGMADVYLYGIKYAKAAINRGEAALEE